MFALLAATKNIAVINERGLTAAAGASQPQSSNSASRLTYSYRIQDEYAALAPAALRGASTRWLWRRGHIR